MEIQNEKGGRLFSGEEDYCSLKRCWGKAFDTANFYVSIEKLTGCEYLQGGRGVKSVFCFLGIPRYKNILVWKNVNK